MKPTALNVFVLVAYVGADRDKALPARVPSVDVNHLKRCIAAGLVGADLKLTDAGHAAALNYLAKNPAPHARN